MSVNAGIKEIFIAPKGNAWKTTIANAFGMGTRGDAKIEFKNFNEISDNKGKKFANMLDFNIEVPTMQILDFSLLTQLISSCKDGVIDVAVLSSGLAKTGGVVNSAEGGIYVFTQPTANSVTNQWDSTAATVTTTSAHNLVEGDVLYIGGKWVYVVSITSATVFVVSESLGTQVDVAGYEVHNRGLGLDFELSFGLKERSLKLMLQGAMRKEAGEKLMLGSSVRDVFFVANRIPSIDDSLVSSGFIIPSYIPSGCAAYFGDVLLDDFKATIKTKSTKNGFNTSIVSGLTVELMAKASGPNYAGLVEILKHELISTPVVLDLDPTGSSKTITFGASGLTKMGEGMISDTERSATFTLSGEYDLDFVSTSSSAITLYKFLQ